MGAQREPVALNLKFEHETPTDKVGDQRARPKLFTLYAETYNLEA
jgi:hypothetical protein